MEFTLNGDLYSVDKYILGWMFISYDKNGNCKFEGNYFPEGWQAMKEAIEYAQFMNGQFTREDIEEQEAAFEHMLYYSNLRSLN